MKRDSDVRGSAKITSPLISTVAVALNARKALRSEEKSENFPFSATLIDLETD